VNRRRRLAALALVVFPWPGAAAQDPAVDPPFVVRTELSERRPWERSQVLYTVRVYRSAGASRADRIRDVDEPALLSGEALIQRLGNAREHTARPRDSDSLVLERRYAIFPQSAGELLLLPVSLQWIGGEFGFRTRRFVAEAAPERLVARAVPSPPPGRWLAARSVRIWDEFERPPEALIAGEPLIRLLGVRIEGQPARQIPEIDPGDGPNFRHFIERAEFEDQITVGGVVGVRRQRAALLALGGGEVALPAIRIHWWNTLRERWETTELPRRVLQAQGPPAPAVARTAATRAEGGALNEWLAGLFAAGWFLTAAAWWISHRILAARRRRRELGTRFAAGSGDAGQRRAKPLAALAAACRQDDARAAEAALLAWARQYFEASPPRSLGELAERCGEPLSDPCRRLSAALYSAQSAHWDPGQLMRAARAGLRARGGTARGSAPPRGAWRGSALPPLWPKPSSDDG